MAWIVHWTEIAWSDLESIAEYIAKDSSHYAAVFVHDVKLAARSLCCFAKRGRVVPELSEPAIRELIIRNYRLIYKISDNNVHIIAFVHGSRDIHSFLDDREG